MATTEGRDHAVVEPETLTGKHTPPWRYAVGMFGTSIPINLIKGSMLYFYVQVLGLDAAVYASVYMVYGIIDAIDNPVFGYISDRTRTRWGRRRPYLIVGAILLLIGMFALFWVPDAVVARKSSLLVVWFAVFAILCEASDSLINANYGALLPELFPTEKRRSLANSLRQGFQLVAMVIATALTPVLARSVLGCDAADVTCTDPTRGYELLAVIYGVLAAAIIIFMAAGIHERKDIEQEAPPKFLVSIKDIVTNPYFWTLGIVSTLYTAAMALILAGLQFYVDFSLGGTALDATIIQGVVILASIAFLVLWTRVVRRRGAAWTWRLALPICAVSFLPLFFANNLVTAIAAGLCVGIGYSGMLATNDLIFARVLDEDARQTDVHREGVFMSAFGVLGRLNAIPTSLALMSLGWFFGYQSGDHPGSNPSLAWRVYMSVYPFIFLAIGALISRFVKVPETPLESVQTPLASVGDGTTGVVALPPTTDEGGEAR